VGRIGGDSGLTEMGERYALALKGFAETHIMVSKGLMAREIESYLNEFNCILIVYMCVQFMMMCLG
jgi:hypothetical protein